MASARVGMFTSGVFQYGQPLALVHPTNNDFTAALYFPELITEPGITPEEREALQREYSELLAALLLGRDFYG